MTEGWSAEKELEAVEAAKRDPREFVRLYDAYADRVFGYFVTRTSDRTASEDLTQETFMSALAAMPRYEWRGLPFGAWLFRIARNKLMDSFNEKRPAALDDGPEPEAPSHGDAVAIGVDAALVWKSSATLTADQQEALALRFKADLPIKEVAEAMGKSEAAVKMLLQRAVRSLAETMNAK